ncbi:hypothetical protein [Microbulbifer spongiae]|uniref:Uncharacterized protein n=1 Tax=Microbulbifer spongiae TaxID=2944933 RepID=A0ABY9E5R0_9GAMM|nr:hypothetical protein [Microbulbifer sp. MI-G]WKD48354.1 hypothetical protein M8T91_10445 [Microbulbifer sp. MI-G]
MITIRLFFYRFCHNSHVLGPRWYAHVFTGKALTHRLQVRNNALSKMEFSHQVIPAALLMDWCNALQVSLQALTLADERDDRVQVLPARYAQGYAQLGIPQRRWVLAHLVLVAQWEPEARPE